MSEKSQSNNVSVLLYCRGVQEALVGGRCAAALQGMSNLNDRNKGLKRVKNIAEQ